VVAGIPLVRPGPVAGTRRGGERNKASNGDEKQNQRAEREIVLYEGVAF